MSSVLKLLTHSTMTSTVRVADSLLLPLELDSQYFSELCLAGTHIEAWSTDGNCGLSRQPLSTADALG